MRRIAVHAAVLAAVVSPAVAGAQLPLESLLSARTIQLKGLSFEPEWLSHAAREFRTQGRFELVAEREDADLIAAVFTDSTYTSGQELIALPIFGGGVIAGVEDSKQTTFYLQLVERRRDRVVWTDSRPVHLFVRGAVLDLVKDLHRAIREAP